MTHEEEIMKLEVELEKEVVEAIDELGDVATKATQLLATLKGTTEGEAKRIITKMVLKHVPVPAYVPNFMVEFGIGLLVKAAAGRKYK